MTPESGSRPFTAPTNVRPPRPRSKAWGMLSHAPNAILCLRSASAGRVPHLQAGCRVSAQRAGAKAGGEGRRRRALKRPPGCDPEAWQPVLRSPGAGHSLLLLLASTRLPRSELGLQAREESLLWRLRTVPPLHGETVQRSQRGQPKSGFFAGAGIRLWEARTVGYPEHQQPRRGKEAEARLEAARAKAGRSYCAWAAAS